MKYVMYLILAALALSFAIYMPLMRYQDTARYCAENGGCIQITGNALSKILREEMSKLSCSPR